MWRLTLYLTHQQSLLNSDFPTSASDLRIELKWRASCKTAFFGVHVPALLFLVCIKFRSKPHICPLVALSFLHMRPKSTRAVKRGSNRVSRRVDGREGMGMGERARRLLSRFLSAPSSPASVRRMPCIPGLFSTTTAASAAHSAYDVPCNPAQLHFPRKGSPRPPPACSLVCKTKGGRCRISARARSPH